MVERRAANLRRYPDLVVIYLGMRVYGPRGLWTVVALRSEVKRAVAAKPDGLLAHESFWFSLVPLHVGLRQYWRDFDSLERWTRQQTHEKWWRRFSRDAGGTGFWHETYCRHGIEGVYNGPYDAKGLLGFAPAVAAQGSMFSAKQRIGANAAQSDLESR